MLLKKDDFSLINNIIMANNKIFLCIKKLLVIFITDIIKIYYAIKKI